MDKKSRLSPLHPRRAKRAASDGPQIVYDGQTMRGSLVRRQKNVIARDARGRQVGTFDTVKDALAAVLGAPSKGVA